MQSRDRSYRRPSGVRSTRRGFVPGRIAGALVLAASALANAAAAEAPRRLTFAELAACPVISDAAAVASGAVLTASIRAANGEQVRLTGYMLPLAIEQGRSRQFLLLRNQNACCFGQMPAANEYVTVEAPAPGLPVRMDTPVAVVGRLRVAPIVNGGAVVQFYQLEETALAAVAP
ncbi:MAG: DUF3299 domain-containing protein [Opitutaceae bacterium]